MTPVELLKACELAASQGLERMILTIPRRSRRSLRSNRVKVMPGVVGTIVGDTGNERLIVDVTIDDVVSALERVMVIPVKVEPKMHPEDLPSGPLAHDGDEPEASP